MANQLAHLVALGLADWFTEQMEDERYFALNNIDPERDMDDPERNAIELEANLGRPLALADEFDTLDDLIQYTLLHPHHPLFIQGE